MEQDDTEAALRDLSETIRLSPDFAPAYFSRGNLLLREGDPDAAMRDFDRLIELCPTLGEAYSGRGNIWIHKGEPEKAAEDYREAIQLDPGSAEGYILQRLLVEATYYHQQARYPEAIEKAGEALEIDPECWPAYHTRAAAYWYSELFVDAVADYTRVMDLTGGSYIACSGRGQVYAEMGEYDRAVADLNRALELAGDDPAPAAAAYPLCGRGLAHAGLEQYEDALRDLEESLRLCPQNAWAHYNLGLLYRQQGKLHQAAGAFRKALEADTPPLTARKRGRVKAFLAQHEKTEER
jgi:tetratricopeptide (TPR) repeat protein